MKIEHQPVHGPEIVDTRYRFDGSMYLTPEEFVPSIRKLLPEYTSPFVQEGAFELATTTLQRVDEETYVATETLINKVDDSTRVREIIVMEDNNGDVAYTYTRTDAAHSPQSEPYPIGTPASNHYHEVGVGLFIRDLQAKAEKRQASQIPSVHEVSPTNMPPTAEIINFENIKQKKRG